MFQTWFSDAIQFVIACGVILNIWTSLRARHEAVKASAAAVIIGADIKALEVNTNSKMDALLAAKQGEADARVLAAGAQGEKIGRDEEIARATSATAAKTV